MHVAIMSVSVIHPDGRTQNVSEYVTDIILGARSKAQKSEELLLQAVRDYVECLVRDVLVNFGQDNRNEDVTASGNGDTDAARTRVSFDCGNTPDERMESGQEQDIPSTDSPARLKYGWTTFTSLFKRDSSRMSPRPDDERRGLFHFLRKRKSSVTCRVVQNHTLQDLPKSMRSFVNHSKRLHDKEESTFSPEALASACSTSDDTSARVLGRSPKKQKPRLMSNDSGIAVEEDSDTDERGFSRTGRLVRIRNSVKNIIFCASYKAEGK